MQDKNVTHEINLGWLLSWCFWSRALSSQSDPAVANTDSALPPAGFTEDGSCESGLEPFLFLGQILSLWDQTRGRFHLYPVWRSCDALRKGKHSSSCTQQALKGEMGLSSESWAELWLICDVHWWAAALFSTLYQQLCLNSLFLQRNRN